MGKKVLVVGGGGREHALAWKLRMSPGVSQIFVAPGNGGTAAIANNVALAADDLPGLQAFAAEKAIDLTVVGPEAPLAGGIVDLFQEAGLPIFGPSQAAARLESSKAFAKRFMRQAGIPTADYATFGAYDAAADYVCQRAWPDGLVIKASGLAAGKGVVVCDSAEQALAALNEMLVDRRFGDAAAEVVVEERLFGPELSLLAFSDGRTLATMAPARDHKRIYDGDQGPNTGGMGAVSPPPGASAELVAQIEATVLRPAVATMRQLGMPYIGVLYAGLILTAAGPKTLEFNCRFGDPEAQVVLPLLQGDLYQVLEACVNGCLEPGMVAIQDGACATVVMASPGYPGSYAKGLAIEGLDQVQEALVFHAGTRQQGDQLLTNGGRVLAVSGLGDSLPAALRRAYQGVASIHFPGAHYRRDIGAVGHLKEG